MINKPDQTESGGAEHHAMDSANWFLVGLQAKGIVIKNPPVAPMTDAEALNLATWIVALVDPDAKEFHRLLAEIKTK